MMKIKFLLESALDFILMFLLIYCAFLWLFSPAHQIPEAIKQVTAIFIMTWICTQILLGDNSNDDWVGGF
jgi:hypothetical protein